MTKHMKNFLNALAVLIVALVVVISFQWEDIESGKISLWLQVVLPVFVCWAGAYMFMYAHVLVAKIKALSKTTKKILLAFIMLVVIECMYWLTGGSLWSGLGVWLLLVGLYASLKMSKTH